MSSSAPFLLANQMPPTPLADNPETPPLLQVGFFAVLTGTSGGVAMFFPLETGLTAPRTRSDVGGVFAGVSSVINEILPCHTCLACERKQLFFRGEILLWGGKAWRPFIARIVSPSRNRTLVSLYHGFHTFRTDASEDDKPRPLSSAWAEADL